MDRLLPVYGSDPEALTDDERDQLDAFLLGDEEAMIAAGWDPDLHPRDHRGRFIEIGDLVHFFLGQDEGSGRVTGIEKGKISIDTERGTIRVRPDQIRESFDVRATLGRHDEVGTSSDVRAIRSYDEKGVPRVDLTEDDGTPTGRYQSGKAMGSKDFMVAFPSEDGYSVRVSATEEAARKTADQYGGGGEVLRVEEPDEIGTSSALAPLAERYRFAKGRDGKVHITHPGYATALDGHPALGTVEDPAHSSMPLCQTCLEYATAETLRLQEAEDEVGSKARLDISPDGGTLDGMPTTVDAPTSVHTIDPRNVGELKARVAKLNKRAEKIGVEPLTLEIGPVRQVEIRKAEYSGGFTVPTGEFKDVVDVTVTGTTPKLAGDWTFLGAVEHHKAGSDLNLIHGEDPRLAKYRTAEPDCDHCHLPRRRAHTVILEGPDGELHQVGRACMKDYLGYHTRPDAYLDWADQAQSITDFDEERVGYAAATYPAESTLATIAAVVRTNGFVPKSAANNIPTADVVKRILNYRPLTEAEERSGLGQMVNRVNVTDVDRETADAVRTWGAAIDEATTNNYLGNLHVTLAQTYYEDRDLGLLSSSISAYQKDAEASSVFRWTNVAGEFKVKGPDAAVGDVIEIQKADGSKVKATVDKVTRPGLYDVSKFVDVDAAGHWGEVGKRAEFTAKVTNVKAFDGDYGMSYLVKLETPEGHVLTTFSSGEFGRTAEIGATVTAKGTVKEHTTFNDQPETKLARVTASHWDWTGTPNDPGTEDEVGTTSGLKVERGLVFLHGNATDSEGQPLVGMVTGVTGNIVNYRTPDGRERGENIADFNDIVGAILTKPDPKLGAGFEPITFTTALQELYRDYPRIKDQMDELDDAYVAHVLDSEGSWDPATGHLPSEKLDPQHALDSHDVALVDAQIQEIAQDLFDQDIITFEEMLRAKGESPQEFDALLARVASKRREREAAEAADEVGTSSDLRVDNGELPGASDVVLAPVLDPDSAKMVSQLTNGSELPNHVDFDVDGDAVGEFADAQQAWLDRLADTDEDDDTIPLVGSAAGMWMGLDQQGVGQMSSEMRGLLGAQLGHPMPPGLQVQIDDLEEKGDPNGVIDGLTHYATALAQAASETPAGHDLFRAIRLRPEVARSIEVGDIIEEPLGSSSRMEGLAAHVAASRGDDPEDADVMSNLFGRDIRHDQVVIFHFPPETTALHITPFNEPEPFKWTAQEYLVSGRFEVTGVHEEDVERLGFHLAGEFDEVDDDFPQESTGSWVPIGPVDSTSAFDDLKITVPAIVVDVKQVGSVITAAGGKVITYFDQGSLFGVPVPILSALPGVLRPMTFGL